MRSLFQFRKREKLKFHTFYSVFSCALSLYIWTLKRATEQKINSLHHGGWCYISNNEEIGLLLLTDIHYNHLVFTCTQTQT